MNDISEKFTATREQIKRLREDDDYKDEVEKSLPKGNIGQYWMPRAHRSYTSLENIVELGY